MKGEGRSVEVGKLEIERIRGDWKKKNRKDLISKEG